MVTVFLAEGREMLAMDEEGTSDPYCKFRSARVFISVILNKCASD